MDFVWPPLVATYVASANLSVFNSFAGYYVLMTTGTDMGECYVIFDYVFPVEPTVYNSSHIRLGVSTSTGVAQGDLFDIWTDLSSCQAA